MASDGTADWYQRAAAELAATSDLQVRWARGIADDAEVLALIDQLPREHRQPSLVFSAARYAGAPAADWPELRPWLVANWPRVAAVARERRTQTNEVGRCAPLLVALDRIASRIASPLALIELGASAGLCLGLDRYSYRFDRGADAGPVVGEGEPLLTCVMSGVGGAPSAVPSIGWRRGVDLAPLSPADPDDVAWLEALLPPDRPDRLARLRAASRRLADDPPEVVAGDALERLPEMIAAAPEGLTPVVVALGTLVYLAPAARLEVLQRTRALGARLVTLEPVAALPPVADRLAGLTAPEPSGFVLALDELPIAFTSAHGDRLSWLTPVGQPDAGAAAS